jgi:hypothetical protein
MSQADQTHNGDSPLNTRDPWQLWAECGHVQSSAAGAPDETSPVEMSERVLNGSRKRPVSGVRNFEPHHASACLCANRHREEFIAADDLHLAIDSHRRFISCELTARRSPGRTGQTLTTAAGQELVHSVVPRRRFCDAVGWTTRGGTNSPRLAHGALPCWSRCQ